MKPFVDLLQKPSIDSMEKSSIITISEPIYVEQRPARWTWAMYLGVGMLTLLLTLTAVMTVFTFVQVKKIKNARDGDSAGLTEDLKSFHRMELLTSGAFVAENWPERTIVKRNTGTACITSCSGLTNGDYQSCNGCDVYASCWDENLIDNRACISALVWDDLSKRCEFRSRTCTADGSTPSTLPTTTPTTTTQEPGTGVCITSCDGKPNGNYQSCISCDVYAGCGDGVLYDGLSCPGNLVWEDTIRQCNYTSTTCT